MQGQLQRGAALAFAVMIAATGCGDGDGANTSTSAAATGPSTTAPATSATSGAPATTSDLSDYTGNASWEAEVARHVEEGNIPSLAAAMVVEGELVWAGGYGEQPEIDTVYLIGSINKTLLATAVMQLVEIGSIDLDADVSDYLPFTMRHSGYPDVPVTVDMLLTHTSELAHDLPAQTWWDNDETMLAWAEERLGLDLSDYPFEDGRPTLTEYTRFFLGPNGAEANEVWIARPGPTYSYSNIAYNQVLRLVVEGASGQPYTSYIEEHILEPLGMNDTGFEAAAFPEGRLAIPYVRFEEGDEALPATGMAASGRLRTTASDLATFLSAHMNGGSAGGVQVLQPESVEYMHARHEILSGTTFPQMGFYGWGAGWELWAPDLSGHSGGEPGFFTQMVMQETATGNVGVVILMNVGCSLACDMDVFDLHFVPIRELLLDEAVVMLETPGE